MSCAKRNFHLDNRLGLDDCALNADEKQNIRINNYELYNPRKDCNNRNFENLAECNNMIVNNGYGVTDSCHIDTDSRLRNGGEYTDNRIINTEIRKCANGNCEDSMNSLENRMRRGNDYGLKNCDTISEVSTLDLQFTPMVPCLAKNIKNPVHYIPDPSLLVRGGAPTRDSLQQKKFLQSQGFKFVDGVAVNACGFD